jgi:hypothetical protein
MPKIASRPPASSCYLSASGLNTQEFRSADLDNVPFRTRHPRGRVVKGRSGNMRGQAPDITNAERRVPDLPMMGRLSAWALLDLLDCNLHVPRPLAAQLVQPARPAGDLANRLEFDLSSLRTNEDFRELLAKVVTAVSRREITPPEGAHIARRVRARMRAVRREARLESWLRLASGMAPVHGIPATEITALPTAHGGGMVTTGTHEQTINTALGEILQNFG